MIGSKRIIVKALFLWSIVALCMHRVVESQDNVPEKCFCYCCPGKTNPYGQRANCNSSSPPLVGSVPIAVGAGDLACNVASCNSWFFTKCPTVDQSDINGAVSIPKCNSCTSSMISVSQNGPSKDNLSTMDTQLDRAARWSSAHSSTEYHPIHALLFMIFYAFTS